MKGQTARSDRRLSVLIWLLPLCAVGCDDASTGAQYAPEPPLGPEVSCHHDRVVDCDCPGGGKGHKTCLGGARYGACGPCDDSGLTFDLGSDPTRDPHELDAQVLDAVAARPDREVFDAISPFDAASVRFDAGPDPDLDAAPDAMVVDAEIDQGVADMERDFGEPRRCVPPELPSLLEAAERAGDGYRLHGRTGENQYQGHCGGAAGGDAAFLFTAPEEGTWELSLDEEATAFDSVLSLLHVCEHEPREIACDDDGGKGLASRLRVRLEGGQTVIVVVDAFREVGGAFALTAQRVQDLAPGAACDPRQRPAPCAPGLWCYAAPGADRPGGCARIEAPHLDELAVSWRHEEVVVVATGGDANGDVVGGRIELLGANREAMFVDAEGHRSVDFTFGRSLLGIVDLEAEASPLLDIRTPGEPVAARVWLRDATEQLSEPIVVDGMGGFVAARAVAEGAPCDERGLQNRCVGDDLACRPSAGDPVCLPVHAPELRDVAGFRNLERRTFGLILEGVDLDEDVAAFAVDFYDAQERPIGVPGIVAGARYVIPVGSIAYEDGRFTFRRSWRPNGLDLADVARVSATLIDSVGLESQTGSDELLQGIQDAVPVGAACDLREALDACEPGFHCVGGPGAEAPTCQGDVGAGCPAGWPVADLGDAWDGEAWRAPERETGTGVPARGSCGGGAGPYVYYFQAPAAGEYTFSTASRDLSADTVVYVRSLCGVESLRAELACDDDSGDGHLSRLALHLGLHEEVWVFVDGFYSPGWSSLGPSALTAARFCDAPEAEVCNGLDDDCNGEVDEGFQVGEACTLGVGACEALGTWKCSDVKDRFCDAQLGQPSEDLCDSLDNDCDGETDEDFRVGEFCAMGTGLCRAEGVFVCDRGGEHCDVRPGLPVDEVCDGEDNDCDGETDEEDAGGGVPCVTDHLGICARGTLHCREGELVCEQDEEPVDELCDGEDNDCNGQVDDQDPGGGAPCGTGQAGVCATGVLHCVDAAIQCVADAEPADEVCDGEDDDCDGAIDNGDPGGGGICDTGELGRCATGVLHCTAGEITCVRDHDPAVEQCDGDDNDCDGEVDEDDPGGGESCATGRPGVCAEGTFRCRDGGLVCEQDDEAVDEVCDGADNDCDGEADDGAFGGGDCDTGEFGRCADGTLRCQEGALVCARDNEPVEEVCDGVDNDCNGEADDGNPEGGGRCDTGLLGNCARGALRCVGGGLVCVPDNEPVEEICDGDDNNCDGEVDGGLGVGDGCSVGLGVCRRDGRLVCDGLHGVRCDAAPGDPVFGTCDDGLDNDCDDEVDEADECVPA